jgi:group I intron endonuclease
MAKRRIEANGRSSKYVTFTCGIYEIYHKLTRRRYIGSSSEVEKRLYHHLVKLRTNSHPCQHMQNVWNKYGDKDFVFFLIETCAVEDLIRREQFYIDRVPIKQRLNVLPVAGSARGFRPSEETRKKMSESAKKFGSSEKERKARSERAKKQHAEKKLGSHTWTEEGRERVRIASRNGDGIKKAQLAAGKAKYRKYVLKIAD